MPIECLEHVHSIQFGCIHPSTLVNSFSFAILSGPCVGNNNVIASIEVFLLFINGALFSYISSLFISHFLLLSRPATSSYPLVSCTTALIVWPLVSRGSKLSTNMRWLPMWVVSLLFIAMFGHFSLSLWLKGSIHNTNRVRLSLCNVTFCTCLFTVTSGLFLSIAPLGDYAL